ncbi:MAG: GNAT family N-acetyltransferase, partial [Treponema sp.]|nr:GNAT family N-acetyltransferase [Treponema sp.]
MKRRDTEAVERILFDRERYCVGAIGRYLDRNQGWIFHRGGPGRADLSAGAPAGAFALILNSHRSLFPILCKEEGIPFPPFMKRLLRFCSLHTVQGLREDVEFLEGGIADLGREPVDRFDYDLMALDREPDFGTIGNSLPGLVLRQPAAADMEELFALQSAYETEEVLPKGAVFNPAVSRLNLARILA